jgi:hypothetical protein
MFRIVAAGISAVFVSVGVAHAQPVAYGWTGFGKNITGNSKCANYKATLGKGGTFKAKDTGGSNRMSVEGAIREGDSKFEIFGYCLFEGKLTKK